MQKKLKILVLLLVFSINVVSCAHKKPSKYMFCTMKTSESAVCSMGEGDKTEIPTSMMLDPPYICQPNEDNKDFVTEFLEKEAELEKCLTN